MFPRYATKAEMTVNNHATMAASSWKTSDKVLPLRVFLSFFLQLDHHWSFS